MSDDACPGEGQCHGCLAWCAECGTVSLVCPYPKEQCQWHHEKRQEEWLDQPPRSVDLAAIVRQGGLQVARDALLEMGRHEDAMRLAPPPHGIAWALDLDPHEAESVRVWAEWIAMGDGETPRGARERSIADIALGVELGGIVPENAEQAWRADFGAHTPLPQTHFGGLTAADIDDLQAYAATLNSSASPT